MKRAPKFSAEYLRSILSYCPETGDWAWLYRADARPQWNGLFAGKAAGYSDEDGYLTIRIGGRLYFANRLAWFYVTGEWPSEEVDHKDVDPGNCRWANLRQATRSKNCANKRAYSNNTSGVKGVCWDKNRSKWFAQIMVDGKTYNLGRFKTIEDAGAAYAAAAKKHFGEFARAA